MTAAATSGKTDEGADGEETLDLAAVSYQQIYLCDYHFDP